VTREFARHGGGEYEDVPLDDEKQSMRAWFGFAEPFDWRKRSYLGPFLSVVGILIVGGLFFLAIAAAFKLLGSAVFGSLPKGAGSSFGLTGIIVAMIGAPFVVWRAFVAQKQVDVAEQGQITDRLNKAVEGLGAEKTVKDEDGESTKPNLEVRIGAIYALERIAQDSLRDHIQIMEILCAYIRENAPLRKTPQNPFEIWEEETTENPDANWLKMPNRNDIQSWAAKLPKPRTDIQVALEVIGRRAPRQIKVERNATVRGSMVGYRLDLRSTCLQGADLSELEFTYCLFNQAQLQGADLNGAQLQGADLNGAQLHGADLIGAQLQGAHLIRAQLQRADLIGAQLQGAHLFRAQLQGAQISGAQLQGAHLFRAQLQGADLNRARLQGADLNGARLQGAQINGAQLQGARLFGALLLGADLIGAQLQGANLSEAELQGAHLIRAQLQGANLSEAELQGADLSGAQLQGAHLGEAQLQGANLSKSEFDVSTSFTAATFRGAALKDVDFTHSRISSEQLKDMFGDASVTLPGGHGPDHENWPKHWSKENLDRKDFYPQHRAFQASIGQDPMNPT
jgi:uncharacterized protein YjbI with pentapeptide repeats